MILNDFFFININPRTAVVSEIFVKKEKEKKKNKTATAPFAIHITCIDTPSINSGINSKYRYDTNLPPFLVTAVNFSL